MASPRLWFGVLFSISEPKLTFPLRGLQKLPSSENVLGRLHMGCLCVIACRMGGWVGVCACVCVCV